MAAPLIHQMNLLPATKSANISIKNSTKSQDAESLRTVSPDHVTCFDEYCFLSNADASQQEKSSKCIPMQHHIHRTNSELQLQEDEVIADYRDYCMYQRIVSGIVKKQQDQEQPTNSNYHQYPTKRQDEDTIRSIIRTRHSPIQEGEEHQERQLEQTPLPQWPLVQPRIQQQPHCILDLDNDDYALSYDDMEHLSVPSIPRTRQTERQSEDEIFVMDL